MEILFSILALVLSVIAISRTNDASIKISVLEKKLKEVGQAELSAVINTSVQQEGAVLDPVLKENAAIDTVEENKESRFVAWMKEDWLLKLGGTLILIGVLFFLSVAFDAVGPLGKISIGYLFGGSLMVFGFKYAKKQLIGGSTIHVIGAIVIIITTYLARQPGYDLFDPYFATLLMLLTVTCVALTAYAYDRPELAHVGLLLAAIVPLLTNTEGSNFTQLLIYLLVVTLGVLWLALVKGWRTLVLLALSILCAYSLMKISASGNVAISFAQSYLLVVFSVLFYITSLFSILRSKGVTQPADGIVALLNAGYALVWITSPISHVTHEFAPIVIAIIGLIYAVGFFFVYKVTNVYTSFLVYGGVAVGLLTTSIMLELSGRAEAVTLLLIGTGVTIFTYYLSNDQHVTKIMSLFNILPLLYVLKSIGAVTFSYNGFGTTSNVWADVAILILAMCLYFGMSTYFKEKVLELYQTALTAGILLSIVIVWQILHLTIGGGFATFLSILTYTLVGLYLLYQGTQQRNETKVRITKMWLGLVALQAIFFAFGTGDIILGVLVSIVIGILLLSTTFILKKVVTE